MVIVDFARTPQLPFGVEKTKIVESTIAFRPHKVFCFFRTEFKPKKIKLENDKLDKKAKKRKQDEVWEIFRLILALFQ